jgi:Secretion system C-terminal sorting domain
MFHNIPFFNAFNHLHLLTNQLKKTGMKKLYISMAAVLFCGLATAQSDQSLETIQLTPLEKQAKLSSVTSQTLSTQSVNRGGCDTLTTELAAGNSYDGNMFDVTAINTVTLETFSVTVGTGNWNIAIYYRTGSYVGFNLSSAGWTFLDSAVVSGAGASIPVQVPVNVALTLTAGNTYAFYVTSTAPASTFSYTNGTAVGTLHASNSDLQFYEGHGGQYPFNLNNSPRVFNGLIHYCPGGVDVAELGSGSAFSVYPNPASQNLSIDLSSYTGTQIPVAIYNSLGEIVYTQTVTAAGVNNVDISSLSQGIYVVDALINNKKATTRFVVER